MNKRIVHIASLISLWALLSGFIFTPPPPFVPSGKGGGAACSQATSLLNRMDGGQNTSAVSAAVCGMVTDGTFAQLDWLHVYEASSQTNALLNWISTSFPGTKHGTVSFAANSGYTGDGSSFYISTGYTPSTASGNWALSSASLGICDLTNATNASQIQIGSIGSQGFSDIAMRNTTSAFVIDGTGGSFSTPTITTNLSSWIYTRTGASTEEVYKNGSAFQSDSISDSGIDNGAVVVFAFNSNGTIGSFTADTLAYAFAGGGLNSTNASNIYSRLHTYSQTIGQTTGCWLFEHDLDPANDNAPMFLSEVA